MKTRNDFDIVREISLNKSKEYQKLQEKAISKEIRRRAWKRRGEGFIWKFLGFTSLYLMILLLIAVNQ